MDTHLALGLAFCTCYSGMLALCLAMDRHHAQVLRGKPSPRRRVGLRIAGWALIGAALWLCSLAWGWAIGPVAWLGLLSAAALGLVFLLPYAPRLAAGLALLAPLCVLPPFLI